MDKLEKLSKLKLKQPKGLRDFIYNRTDYLTNPYCSFGCVEVIEQWNDTWILRVFAYKRHSKKERTYKNIQFQEIQRKLLGYKKHLVGDVWSNMSGRNVNWHSENPYYKNNGFWIADSDVWEFYGYQMYDEKEIIEILDIPYCAWEIAKLDVRNKLRFFDYIGLYLKEPKIELLVKGGLSQYLTSLRYLDLKKKKINEVFKIEQSQENILKWITTSELLLLRKHPEVKSAVELRFINSIKNYQEIENLNDYLKVSKYLAIQREKSKGYRLESIFNDYLLFAKEFNLNLSRNKYCYPEDLMAAHDDLAKRHDMIIDERNTLAFEKQYKKFEELIYERGQLIIMPVKTPTDLRKESSELNHCVSSYADIVAKGETEIFFIREKQHKDTPFITVEVQNNAVRQVRGKNNCSPSEEVVKFIKTWSRKNKLQCKY